MIGGRESLSPSAPSEKSAGCQAEEVYTEIEYEQRDQVGIITIDRPDARNALTFTTYAELADAVETTTARCLVITGRDPAFCSGDDVKQVSYGLRLYLLFFVEPN